MAASSLSNSPVFHVHRFPILDRLAGFWRRLAHEIRIRNDLRRLAAYDDAALSDIGVSRGGIEGAIRHDNSRRT